MGRSRSGPITIGLLRALLAETGEQFPLLLGKVLYHGGHCGDHLTVDEVGNLAAEIHALRRVHAVEKEQEDLLRHFEHQMV
jgi:hypothetical protein